MTEKDVTVPGDVTVLRVENGRLAWRSFPQPDSAIRPKKLVTIGITGDQGEDHHQHMVKAILEAAGKRWGSSAPMGLSSARKNMPQPTPPRNPIWYRNIFAKMVEAGCTPYGHGSLLPGHDAPPGGRHLL